MRPRRLSPGDRLDGETAFKLYDTYGFPLDLTQDALRQRGITVDTDGFNAAMARQKAEARASWAGSGEAATEAVWFPVRDKAGATEFLGYGTEKAEGIVAALVATARSSRAGEGETVGVVVNQTPFYGESGGQMGDTGTISGEGFRIEVTDTQKKGDGLFVHEGRVVKGTVKTGAAVELEVDHARRTRLRSNHSATHLVHEALREVLGTHVAQKGSLVAPERLRFDFSHPKPISADELEKVEKTRQRDRRPEQPRDDAADVGRRCHRRGRDGAVRRKIRRRGARRLDGYGDSGDKAGKPYSVELCGGTHVNATGDIGIVRLVGENAVAAGVRRIEALTGEAARRHLDEQERRLKAVASALKVAPADVPARVEALIDERRKLEKELVEARKKLALGGGNASRPAKRPRRSPAPASSAAPSAASRRRT